MIFSYFLWSVNKDRNSCPGITTSRDRLQFTLPPSQDLTWDQASRLVDAHYMPRLPYTQWQEVPRSPLLCHIHHLLWHWPWLKKLILGHKLNLKNTVLHSSLAPQNEEKPPMDCCYDFWENYSQKTCPVLFPKYFPLSGDAIWSPSFQRFRQLSRQAWRHSAQCCVMPRQNTFLPGI